jgi:hypothetical protein
MDEKTILLSFLGKTLGRTNEELTDLLYEKSGEEIILRSDALTVLASLDVERVQKLKGNTKELFDNGYKKAQKELMSDFEKQVRDKYDIDSEKVGIDLIDELVTAKAAKSKLKDDEVKLHPLFIDLEKRKNDEIKQVKGEYEGKVTDLQNQFQRKTKLERVRDDAKRIFMGLNPVISENTVVASNRERDFMAKFDEFDYELDDKGNHIIVKDGKRMEDEHANPITFDGFVKDKAMLYYDFAKQTAKGSAAQEAGRSTSSVTVPKDHSEFMKLYTEESDPQKKVALQQAFYASQGKEFKEIH